MFLRKHQQDAAKVKSSSNKSSLEADYFYQLARFERQLSKASSIQDVSPMISKALADSGFSGCFTFNNINEIDSITFGQHKKNYKASTIDKIKAVSEHLNHVKFDDELILVKTSQSFMFLDRNIKLEKLIPRFNDLLAMFVECLDNWADRYCCRNQLLFELRESLEQLIQANQRTIDNQFKLSKILNFKIADNFHSLDFTAEQQKAITESIKSASDQQVTQIKKEIESQSKIGDRLIAAIALLEKIDLSK